MKLFNQNYNEALIACTFLFVLTGCESKLAPVAKDALPATVITKEVPNDTDDPAIWINPMDSTEVLIVGTDKHEKTGGLYVFDKAGNIVNQVNDLDRPNNVDIAYGLKINGVATDIAVTTERGTNKLRVFSLPSMKPVDNGGIEVFVGEEERGPMGIALYTKKDTSGNKIYAIVGRKNGPKDGYLFQYELAGDKGYVEAKLVRQFGQYSQKKEIEAIAVDNDLGYVYYSDETFGLRKYYADPEKGNQELALFGQKDFKSDHEGIAIYKTSPTEGYIMVSNQQDNSVNVYKREGEAGQAHQHVLVKKIPISTIECDGMDATSVYLGDKFPKGMLVAMSNGRVFHYYDFRELEKKIKE